MYVHEYSILNNDQCKKALSEVMQLHELWVPRGSNLEYPYFYTLGAASYLDAKNPAEYLKKVKQCNPILKEKFGWLYQILIEKLKQNLGQECVFDENLSLPGFHIYKQQMPDGGKIHFDMQYLQVPWGNIELLNLKKTASQTLVLELPVAGSGLCYWPDFTGQLKKTDVVDTVNLDKGREEIKEYQKGNLYYFEGRLLHQIRPNKNFVEGDLRITLQSHTVWNQNGYWIVYW